MKKVIKKIILNKTIAGHLIKPVLRLHTNSYKWAGRLAIILNNGIHPKHQILKYKEWFSENIHPDWTILDIDSDTGLLSSMLSEKAAFVYGIEINPDSIALSASQRPADNIEYICADAVTYDYTCCRPINCVVLSNVLEHIENRIDFLKKLISQLNWADENQKRFLIRVPMYEREWVVPYKKQLGLDNRLDLTHYIEYTQQQLKQELEQAGILLEQLDIRFGEFYAVCRASS